MHLLYGIYFCSIHMSAYLSRFFLSFFFGFWIPNLIPGLSGWSWWSLRHSAYLFPYFYFDIAWDVVPGSFHISHFWSTFFCVSVTHLLYTLICTYIWTHMRMHTCTISAHMEEWQEPSAGAQMWFESVGAASWLEAKADHIYIHTYRTKKIDGTPRPQL